MLRQPPRSLFVFGAIQGIWLEHCYLRRPQSAQFFPEDYSRLLARYRTKMPGWRRQTTAIELLCKLYLCASHLFVHRILVVNAHHPKETTCLRWVISLSSWASRIINLHPVPCQGSEIGEANLQRNPTFVIQCPSQLGEVNNYEANGFSNVLRKTRSTIVLKDHLTLRMPLETQQATLHLHSTLEKLTSTPATMATMKAIGMK